MKDYKQQAKDMAKARLEKMGGKRSERVNSVMRADGGRVCKADGGSMMHDEPDGDEFNSGAEMDGESSKPRLDKPSRGAGKTTVNIIVGKGQDAPPAPPMAMPMPPPPPPAPPMGAGPMPPMPMRANGGRIKKEDGGSVEKSDRKGLGSAALIGGGLGTYLAHSDKYLPPRVRALGKLVGAGMAGAGIATAPESKKAASKDKAEERASGGRMTAGAATGEGRLEKAELARKHK